jgi:hypothetical protein
MVEKTWRKMKQAFANDPVFVLYDSTRKPWSCLYPVSNLFIVNSDVCKQDNPLHQSSYQTVESSLMLLYKYVQENNISFDYLYLIEYDVYCPGNWFTTFQKIDKIKPFDFAATHVEPYHAKQNGGWHFWKNPGWQTADEHSHLLEKKKDKRFWWKSFFPVTVYSNTFLSIFQNRYYGQLTGYCEILFPSVAFWEGCKIVNLPSNMIGSIYRFDRAVSNIKGTDNRLYHPVRELSQQILEEKLDKLAASIQSI